MREEGRQSAFLSSTVTRPTEFLAAGCGWRETGLRNLLTGHEGEKPDTDKSFLRMTVFSPTGVVEMSRASPAERALEMLLATRLISAPRTRSSSRRLCCHCRCILRPADRGTVADSFLSGRHARRSALR